MDYRTTAAHEFRIRLGFKLYDVILTKEQSALTKIIKSSFEGENRQTQYSVLGYRIQLYFHDHNLTKEIDGNGHSDRIIDHEIEKIKKK